MNFIRLIFGLFILLNSLAIGQSVEWCKTITGSSNVVVEDMAIDNNYNVISTGMFFGEVDLDPGIGIYSATDLGAGDIYIQKLDANGNFMWAKTIGGIGDDESYGVSIDENGNIYVTGSFEDTVDFDSGSAVFNLACLYSDAFILKLDSDGNFLWAGSFQSLNSVVSCYDVAVDTTNDFIYLVGGFSGITDFDPGPGNYFLPYPSPAFVIKLDLSGNLISVFSLEGSWSVYGHSVTLDDSSNVYISGDYTGDIDFDPGPGSNLLSAGPSNDAFILKLNSDGDFLWAKTFGGTDQVHAYDVIVDSLQSVYITGAFKGTTDLNPGIGTANYSSLGLTDIYLVKLDSIGNFLWAETLGSPGAEWGRDLGVLNNGDVFIAGEFQTTVDFDPGTSNFNLSSAGSRDIFIQRLNATGNFIWAGRIGSAIGADLVKDFAIKDDFIYVTGYFQGNADLDPTDSLLIIMAPDIKSGFVEKLNICYLPDTPSFFFTSVSYCEGDSLNLGLPIGNLNSADNWHWYQGTCGGVEIGQGDSIWVSPITPTEYFVRAEGTCITEQVCSSILISQYPSLNVTFLTTDEIIGNDGSIDLTLTGTGAPYIFNWTGPMGFVSSLEDLSGLTSGIYTVEIIDTYGCNEVINIAVASQLGNHIYDNFVTLYPNPGNGLVKVDFAYPVLSPVNIIVRDFQGRIIVENYLFGDLVWIDLTQFVNGVYAIEILCPTEKYDFCYIKE
ncbi:MAG: SBBP repeat-containing protein [Crocinitomicaceae bacterium]|nr:SBBP repeat-containing protein [Crocinitomicaceae bacterium]